jgi:hypothetical protein
MVPQLYHKGIPRDRQVGVLELLEHTAAEEKRTETVYLTFRAAGPITSATTTRRATAEVVEQMLLKSDVIYHREFHHYYLWCSGTI